jgi:hypothetical protein
VPQGDHALLAHRIAHDGEGLLTDRLTGHDVILVDQAA